MLNSDRLDVERDRLKIKEAVLSELGITPAQKGFKLDGDLLSPLLASAGQIVDRSALQGTITTLRDNDTDKRYRRINVERLMERISHLSR